MKITLDLDDRIACVFLNYVAITQDGMMMGCKSIPSADLMEGNTIEVRPSEPEE